MDKRVHLLYSGVVQGVGFRFTARDLANRHSVKGWVRNLRDGRVEMEAEGDDTTINSFLADLNDSFKGNIIDVTREELDIWGEDDGFEIRF